jgi:hypothetical protein
MSQSRTRARLCRAGVKAHATARRNCRLLLFPTTPPCTLPGLTRSTSRVPVDPICDPRRRSLPRCLYAQKISTSCGSFTNPAVGGTRLQLSPRATSLGSDVSKSGLRDTGDSQQRVPFLALQSLTLQDRDTATTWLLILTRPQANF